MKVVLVIILALFSGNLSGQDNYVAYYLKIDSANYLKSKSNYQSAIDLYTEAFEIAEGRGNDYLQIAECYFKTENYDLGLQNVFKSIEAGVPKRYLDRLKKTNKDNERFNEVWGKIEDSYHDLRKTFYAKINIDTYTELQIIKNSDQEIRKFLMSKEFFFQDSILMAYGKTIDSLNLEKLLEIIKNEGTWPGAKSYGDAEAGAYYVLLHMTKENFDDKSRYEEIYDYVHKVAKEGVYSGELTPFQFAYWIDYNLKSEEGKLMYALKASDDLKESSIKDIENLERRRREIGLPSFETTYIRANKELPDWYKGHVEKKE